MTSQTNLTQSYDIAASQWRTKIEGLGYAAAYRWLVGQSGLCTHGAHVLDAGCGTGDFSRALIEVAGPPRRLTLLDPSSEMVNAASRSVMHIAPDVCNTAVGLEDADIVPHDIVLCAHVIEHFANPLVALRLLKAQMSPGGQLLLVVSKPHWCNWIIWVRWRHRMITPNRMRDHFKAVDLRCKWDAGFPAGPPSRSSHAYLVEHH